MKFPPAFLWGKKPVPQVEIEDKCHKPAKFRLCSCDSENAFFDLVDLFGGKQIRHGTLKTAGVARFLVEEGTMEFSTGCNCPWHSGCYHFWHWALNTPQSP